MKISKLAPPSAALAIAVMLSACGGRPTGGENPENHEASVKLGLTYVSGHLGQSGCSTTSAKRAGADFAPSPGACAPGAYCPPMPCEGASLVVRVRNDSDEDITDLDVGGLELLDLKGKARGDLSVEQVHENGSQPFDGKLPRGGEVTLRIDFSGPIQRLLGEMSKTTDARQAYGALVRVTFVVGKATKALTTPELHVLPSVAT